METEEAVNTKMKPAPVQLARSSRINSAPSFIDSETAFERLGSKIGELMNYIKGRTNVHGEIKRLANSIGTAYNLVRKENYTTPKKTRGNTASSTQTSPWMTTSDNATPTFSEQFFTPKSVAPSSLSGAGRNKKRALATTSPNPAPDEHATKKPATETSWTVVKPRSKHRELQTGVPPVSVTQNLTLTNEDAGVAGHRKAKRKKPNGLRQQAVLIKPSEGKSFAELFKDIKAKVKPDELGAEIKSVRKTAKGDVLLHLGSKTKDCAQFSKAVKEAV